jgi:essential nuclear protein 1
VDAKSSRRILKIGQDLAEEERAEHPIATPNAAFAFESRLGSVDSDDEQHRRDDNDEWGDEDEEIVEEVVSTKSRIITWAS